MDPISLEDQDEVDLLLTELELSQGRGNLVLCAVASPAYREKVIQAVEKRFSSRIIPVQHGDLLISDLRSMREKGEGVLIWILPEHLAEDILNALNNFRELFYEAGMPSAVFMTPAALDDVIWQAPDFWRYRGGFHLLKGQEGGLGFRAAEALSMPHDIRFQNKEDLLRRKRINEYMLEKMKDPRERGDALNDLGTIHLLLGGARKAIEYSEQALKISRETRDRRGERNALGILANGHLVLGETGKAIDRYEQALAMAREAGDRRGDGNYLGNLGAARSRMGEPRKAIEYYDQALKICREIGDRRGEGAHLGNLGIAYASLGEPRRAIEHYEKALAILREIGDRWSESIHLGNLGNAYAVIGEMHRAIEHYEQALKIAREIGDRRGEGDHLYNLSLDLNELGQRAQAVERAREALQIFEQIESPGAEQARRQLAKWQKPDEAR